MSTLRLCYWTIYPNGHQRAFIGALRAAGVDVAVCYFGRYDAYRLAQGWSEPETLPPGEFRVRSLAEARRLIPDYGERLVVLTGFYNRVYWQNLLYLIRARKPWVHYSEGTPARWRSVLHRRIYGWCVDRFARRAFAIGDNARDDFIRHWGIRPTKIRYLPYATPRLPPAREEKRYTFVFCGSLIRRKGIDILSEAFCAIRRDFPDATLLVVGDGPLRHLLDHPGIHCTGALPPEEIPSRLAQAEVCILPSRFDGWGMALAEAARENLALIATDRCGAAAHLIETGKNGFMIPAENSAALTGAMRAYCLNPALARGHGEHARELVAETFPDRVAARFLEELRT